MRMSSWEDDTIYDATAFGVDVEAGAGLGLTTALTGVIEQYEHERDRARERDDEEERERTERFIDKRTHQIQTLRSMLEHVEDEHRLDTDRPIYDETLRAIMRSVDEQVESLMVNANTYEGQQRLAGRSRDLEAFQETLEDHVETVRQSDEAPTGKKD